MSFCNIFVTLMLIFTVSGICFAQTIAPTDDNQSWNDVQLTVPITKEINGVVTGTVRFGQNFRHFVDERIAAGLSYKVNKYATVGSNYVYRASQPYKNRKSFESRWQNYVTFSFPVKKYLISNRNMVEYRFINSRPNVWDYRNRTQIEREIKLGKTKIKPFGYAEFFYDGNRKDWFRGRYAIGISRKFNNHFTLDVFYLRQQDGISRPGNLNVIGTAWKFHL